jgi:hypothetical protein
MQNNVFRTLPSRAGVVALALTFAIGGVAGAQTPALTDDGPAAQAPAPSYASPATDAQISGSITVITGKYTLQIRDDRGYVDNVTLHQGTVINPTGLKLQPGMHVAISGVNAGDSFAANQIDTPYTVTLVQPLYPAYGFGVGLGFGFGGPYGGFWAGRGRWW